MFLIHYISSTRKSTSKYIKTCVSPILDFSPVKRSSYKKDLSMYKFEENCVWWRRCRDINTLARKFIEPLALFVINVIMRFFSPAGKIRTSILMTRIKDGGNLSSYKRSVVVRPWWHLIRSIKNPMPLNQARYFHPADRSLFPTMSSKLWV